MPETMEVLIQTREGMKRVQRQIVRRERHPELPSFWRPIPQTSEGESIHYIVGDDTPLIIRKRL